MRTVVSRFEARPVGQGAFIRGQVEFWGLPPSGALGDPFRWVYDCGTESSDTIIDSSVDDLGVSWPSNEELDVLVISHFDKDHISGLPTLLSRYRFRHIFMPHLPRLVRLLAVLEGTDEVSPDRMTELLAFADDPIQYIRSRGGGETRIVLVDSIEDDAPESGGEEGTSPINSRDLNQLDPSSLPEQTRFDGSGHNVFAMSSGQPILLSAGWELIPYIDSQVRKLLLTFDPKDTADLDHLFKLVMNLSAGLSVKLGSHTLNAALFENLKKDLKHAIKDLRNRLYSAIQKKILVSASGGKKITSKNKNAISLMVYMGPIFQGQFAPRYCAHIEVGVGLKGNNWIRNLQGQWRKGLGILLTGDADLSQVDAISRLIACLKPRRLSALGIFQVPHHGSSHNSTALTASGLSAAFNFINANPHSRHQHPHAAVIGYFKNLVLVNSRAFEVTLIASHYGSTKQHPGVWHCLPFAKQDAIYW